MSDLIKKGLYRRKRIKKVGLPPGTLVYTGEKPIIEPKIKVIDFNEKEIIENIYTEVNDNFRQIPPSKIRWINVEGIHNIDIIEKLGRLFNLHPLLLEDILSVDQRPKFEDYDDYISIILKLLSWDSNQSLVDIGQATLIMGKNYVISLQEIEWNLYKPIRERLHTSKGKVRKKGADYLFYTLLDVITDNYFVILDRRGEDIEEIDIKLVEDLTPDTLQAIFKLKRELIYLRKTIRPMREVINSLERDDTPLVDDSTKIYIRDVYDHISQINDIFDNYRDSLQGLHDMYLSSVSFQMNEVMQKLTIITLIFIPLSFLSGFYGMNFILPDFGGPLFFPLLIIIMVGISVLMVAYFKKKKWI